MAKIFQRFICKTLTTRVKKWYWCLYTWFLNISMVQAWRLYRAHMKERNRLVQLEEQDEDARWEVRQVERGHSKSTIDLQRREREKEKRKKGKKGKGKKRIDNMRDY